MAVPCCRTLLCERGLLQRADGSARWSQSNSNILAAVYGPRATVSRKEDPQQAVVEVVFKPKSGYVRAGEAGEFWVPFCVCRSCSVVLNIARQCCRPGSTVSAGHQAGCARHPASSPAPEDSGAGCPAGGPTTLPAPRAACSGIQELQQLWQQGHAVCIPNIVMSNQQACRQFEECWLACADTSCP